MNADESSVRALLVPLLQKVGLKSPALADALDLNFDGIKVEGECLVLPDGYIHHVMQQHPHWFHPRHKTYRNNDRLWDMVHPDFVFRRQEIRR